MLSSIGKFSKSLSIKVLVGIIILPFIFWGMGSSFVAGDKNTDRRDLLEVLPQSALLNKATFKSLLRFDN